MLEHAHLDLELLSGKHLCSDPFYELRLFEGQLLHALHLLRQLFAVELEGLDQGGTWGDLVLQDSNLIVEFGDFFLDFELGLQEEVLDLFDARVEIVVDFGVQEIQVRS